MVRWDQNSFSGAPVAIEFDYGAFLRLAFLAEVRKGT